MKSLLQSIVCFDQEFALIKSLLQSRVAFKRHFFVFTMDTQPQVWVYRLEQFYANPQDADDVSR